MVEAVHVIGASGRSGSALCRALISEGVPLVPIVRDQHKWATRNIAVAPRVADLTDQISLRIALRDATSVVSSAHARHAAAVIAAAPPGGQLIFLGSTRKFTRWPDEHGKGVIAGETAFLASGRNGIMLHPTMIYGAEGENNVQRLAVLLRRLPLLPLPGGGRALVQPIHQDDVTRAIRAALVRQWRGPRSLVIAGPEPVSYVDFIRLVASAAGLPRLRTVAFPAAPLIAAAALSRLIPWVPDVTAAEVRRLLEDKAFDIGPMRTELGVEPVALEDGLARTFSYRP